jgi:DNA-binding MarR family transcriptional regulator
MNASQVLSFVQEFQGCTPSFLCERRGCAPSALSYHIKKLEEEGRLLSVWDQGKKRLFVPSPEVPL